MLKYKVGNLIEAAKKEEVGVIAHQCNCFCAMGAGIAPQIAEAFPEAEEADNATVRGDETKMGTFSHAWSEEWYLDIYNLYGQYKTSNIGMATDYTALRTALRAMANDKDNLKDWINYEQQDNNDYSTVKFGLPKIGAGLGRGDWTVISKIIEEELNEFDVTIYVLDEKEIPKDC